MIQAKNVHLIGVGGIGTSAMAKWWLHQGAAVSGSDIHESAITKELAAKGVTIKIGHFADNVPRDADFVIYSAAVPATNPERQYVSENGIKSMSYNEFLGELSKEKKTIAVSGTNGKSTTTAMIADILIAAGYDPTVVLGTKSPSLKEGNLRIGGGDWMVVEACEHMAHMLHVQPRIAVITNIEEDHLDFYKDLDHIRETFQTWIDKDENCKFVVLNAEDEESRKLRVANPAYFKVNDRTLEEGLQKFDVTGVDVELLIPGRFNAENAAAALVATHAAGVKTDIAVQALKTFKGTWRRFERVGEWGGADIFSDYAHHPTALRGSLKAFKEFFPDRRFVVVFEPHQHSRTHELYQEFVESFDVLDAGDQLILAEVYEVAGRTEQVLETSEDLARDVEVRVHSLVHYAKDHEAVKKYLVDVVKEDDLVIFMGAGSIDAVARELVDPSLRGTK